MDSEAEVTLTAIIIATSLGKTKPKQKKQYFIEKKFFFDFFFFFFDFYVFSEIYNTCCFEKLPHVHFEF